MDCAVALEGGALFVFASAARSGCMSILSSGPPACLTSSAATFSARSMLVRNIARYFSEPALRFQISSINEQVPEIICKRLLSSLAALAIESGGPVGGDRVSVSEFVSGG